MQLPISDRAIISARGSPNTPISNAVSDYKAHRTPLVGVTDRFSCYHLATRDVMACVCYLPCHSQNLELNE